MQQQLEQQSRDGTIKSIVGIGSTSSNLKSIGEGNGQQEQQQPLWRGEPSDRSSLLSSAASVPAGSFRPVLAGPVAVGAGQGEAAFTASTSGLAAGANQASQTGDKSSAPRSGPARRQPSLGGASPSATAPFSSCKSKSRVGPSGRERATRPAESSLGPSEAPDGPTLHLAVVVMTTTTTTAKSANVDDDQHRLTTTANRRQQQHLFVARLLIRLNPSIPFQLVQSKHHKYNSTSATRPAHTHGAYNTITTAIALLHWRPS